MFHYCADSLKQVPGICHAFMTRRGGTSPAPWNSLNVSYHVGDVATRVDENRARICMQWGLLPTSLYVAKQVHATRLLPITKDLDCGQLRWQEADALYSCDAGVLVGVSTADCAPILLASSDARAVCAVHAGWRGAALGIVARVLQQLQQQLAIAPSQWRAAIGPHIGASAFAVGADVLQAFPADSDCFVQHSATTWLFDLSAVLLRQLKRCGVQQVEALSECTFEQSDHFFSHRAAAGRASGRQLSVIGICER